MDLYMNRVPLIGDTFRLVDEGCIPGASFRNLDFVEKDTLFSPDLSYNLRMIRYGCSDLRWSVYERSEDGIGKSAVCPS